MKQCLNDVSRETIKRIRKILNRIIYGSIKIKIILVIVAVVRNFLIKHGEYEVMFK